MFKTLYGKIASILFVLFVSIGVLNIFITLHSTRSYIQEVSQRLHRNLADYLVSERLYIYQGQANEQAFKETFDTLMHINPNIELYLLDIEGNILAFSAPEGKVKRLRVDMEPVKTFLQGAENLPILGDDPRDPGRQKIFTASPVISQGRTEGYLYVILGGEEYDSVAKRLQASYILRLSTWRLLASLFIVFASGLFLFNLLTRRHRKLAKAMQAFKQSDFTQAVELPYRVKERSADEIDRLGTIFKQMSARIIQQINKIRRVDSLRKELVSHVSHDLRTPLSSLQGYLETLSMKGTDLPPEKRKEYLSTAMRQAQRLEKLIFDLFELAKLDSDEVKIHPEPFHLGELVQDLVQKNELEAEKRKIELISRFPKDIPFVRADIGLIERAIQNLVDNALRNTQEGGMITLSLNHEGSQVSVRVEDNGYGISQEELPHIFERYFRGEKGKHKKSDSTGLGLAITKRIMELHNSQIDVSSEVGSGSVFTFSLPISGS